MTSFWTQARIRWGLTWVTVIGACVFLYAQGQPVSIQQLGTGTAVTTTLPVSGTVAATQSGTWTVQPGNTANTTAWKVDGSAVTQPVSGTVTANMGTVTADPFGANADAASATGSISAKLRFIAATGIPITGTVAATQSGTWTVQPGNTANTTAWKVDGSAVTQPVSGTVTANMGTVTADPFGANADAASATGSISAKLRFIASTGIPVVLGAETTKVIGTVRNLGNVGAAFDAATGAAPPANALLAGGVTSGATGGFLKAITVCDSYVNINRATASTFLEITGVSGRHIRVCALNLVTNAANNVGLISGTGATCGTGTTAVIGTTAATGWNFAANGGIAIGSGLGQVLQTVATGDSLCSVTSAATQLSGSIAYAIW